MEIYLKKKSQFGTITRSKDLVCIKRIEKEITQVCNVWTRGNGDVTIELNNYDESYLDNVKDYKTDDWEECDKSEFWTAYETSLISINKFK